MNIILGIVLGLIATAVVMTLMLFVAWMCVQGYDSKRAPKHILELLAMGPSSGDSLRKALGDINITLSAPHFYAVMAEMEDKGHVEGYWQETKIVTLVSRSRWYRLPQKVSLNTGPMCGNVTVDTSRN